MSNLSSAFTKTPRNGYRAKVLGYMRVSKDDEITGSHTFETQELRIRERLDRIYGVGKYDLEMHRDDGVSGSLGLNPTPLQRRTRKSLQEIAQKIGTKTYDCLIVYSQSRLFRNPRAFMEFIEDVLLPTETELTSATEEISIGTAEGRLLVHLMAIFDGMYRDAAVKRNKDGAATAKQLGNFVGQVPYGWDWQPLAEFVPGPGKRRSIVPIPEQREWLLFMKEHYLAGWSGRRIAGELNDLRVAPPSHQKRWDKKADLTRNARWTGSEVVRILSSPTHAGLIEKDGETIKGKHFERRLWEPEEYQAIHALKVTRQEKFKTVTAKSNNQQILSGLIHCARCGRRLYSSSTNPSTKAYRGYVCLNGQQQGQPTCPNMNVRAQWVEDAVVEELGRLAATPEMRRILESEAEKLLREESGRHLKEREQLKQSLAGFADKFERWATLFSEGKLTSEQFDGFNRKMRSEQQAIEARLAEIEAADARKQERRELAQRVHCLLVEVPSVWEELDYDERRHVLASLLESLTADREDRLIRLRIKVLLLPENEIVIPYRSLRGKNRCTADPITRLTKRELSILYLMSQGLTQVQIAARLNLKKNSIFVMCKNMRKKCDKMSYEEIIERAKTRIEAVLPYLPIDAKDKPTTVIGKSHEQEPPFLSGVLMEVFPLFARGASVAEVARRLNLPEVTIQGRRARILKLMKTSSILEAVERAEAQGILKAERY